MGPWMVVDRQLRSFDDTHAEFTQRRQLISCPPSSGRSAAIVIVILGIMPWAQWINPPSGSDLPPIWLASAWSAFFVFAAFTLLKYRRRRYDAFVYNARQSGADIDVGACPDSRLKLGTGRMFVVRFHFASGQGTLKAEDGTILGSTSGIRWIERTGHSLPWSDANEGDPHDTATIFLLVEGDQPEDFAGRFTITATSIDDQRLEEVRKRLVRVTKG